MTVCCWNDRRLNYSNLAKQTLTLQRPSVSVTASDAAAVGKPRRSWPLKAADQPLKMLANPVSVTTPAKPK